MQTLEDINFSSIPEVLQLKILEKFIYKDYANFTQCSQFGYSAGICSRISSELKLEHPALEMRFVEKNDWFWNGGTVKISLERVPENVKFKCTNMFIRRPITDSHCVDLARKHQMTTNKLELRSSAESSFFEQLMKIVRPKYLVLEAEWDLLKLPEVQNTPCLLIECKNEGIDEDTFLSLNSQHLTILDETGLKENDIVKIVKQWIWKERTIKLLCVRIDVFDIEMFRRGVGEEHLTEIENRPLFLFICRSRDHSDCLLFRKDTSCVHISSGTRCSKNLKNTK